MDYIVGNTGLNTFYKATDQYPVYITAKDFDGNGSFDAITSVFLKDKNGEMKESPVPVRDDIIKQMLSMRTKFPDYKSYATATIDEVITPDMRNGAIRLKATTLQSVFLRNDGNGKFTIYQLQSRLGLSKLH